MKKDQRPWRFELADGLLRVYREWSTFEREWRKLREVMDQMLDHDVLGWRRFTFIAIPHSPLGWLALPIAGALWCLLRYYLSTRTRT